MAAKTGEKLESKSFRYETEVQNHCTPITMIKDPYYSEPEVSNSDLSWLKNQFAPVSYRGDVEKAYRFGTLIDCMITEPEKVDYFTRECAGVVYSIEEFEQAQEMKRAFYRDELCKLMVGQAKYQQVMKRRMAINYCRY